MAKPTKMQPQKMIFSHFLRGFFSATQGFSYSPPAKRALLNFRWRGSAAPSMRCRQPEDPSQQRAARPGWVHTSERSGEERDRPLSVMVRSGRGHLGQACRRGERIRGERIRAQVDRRSVCHCRCGEVSSCFTTSAPFPTRWNIARRPRSQGDQSVRVEEKLTKKGGGRWRGPTEVSMYVRTIGSDRI